MSQDLLTTETHVTDYQGAIKFVTTLPLPADGDEIQNIEAGQMVYNSTQQILYIYDGSAWFGSLTVVST